MAFLNPWRACLLKDTPTSTKRAKREVTCTFPSGLTLVSNSFSVYSNAINMGTMISCARLSISPKECTES
jgi:hypothetical protein